MKKTIKSIMAMSLAAAMAFAPAVTTLAATNIQSSVDSTKSTVPTILQTNTGEITLSLGSVYNLKPRVSTEMQTAGFDIVNSKLQYQTKVDGVLYTKKVDLTINTARPDYVSVSTSGKVAGKKVCKFKANNVYYQVPVTFSVPDVVYYVYDESIQRNIKYEFKNGVVSQTNVTVVPENDLLVYYLGVWSEDKVNDTDAIHYQDIAVDSNNVKQKLVQMAEYVTKHCVSETSSLTALTKTNDGVVRAYFKAYSKTAGNHYYILKFNSSTEDKRNKITVSSRDYCDLEYVGVGNFYRTGEVLVTNQEGVQGTN